ncbi:MAG: hypothetical protein MHM6MM_000384 [Cercozoa sp. M6MM]
MEKTGEKRARKQRGGRPKKRARGVEQFLDIEAEHDDEDDDFEEEGDAEEVRDFILEETDVDAAQNMMQARRLMAQSDAFGDADEQESMKRLASELEQRYRRQQPQQQRRQPQAEAPGQTAPPQQSVPAPVQKKAQYVQDELDVKLESAMQQSLLPSIQDPRLFAVRCRIGLERDAVVDLLTRYYLTKHSRQKRMLIKTAFAPLEGVGYIYVEAYKLDHVRLAIKDVRALRTDQDEKQGLGTTLSGFNKEAQQSKASETTRRDMPGARTNKFMRHRTVRITRGPHKGALATVISTDDTRFLLSLNTTGRLVHVQLADAAPLQSDKTRATLSNFRDLARMPAGGQRMDAAAVGGRTGAYSGGRTGASVRLVQGCLVEGVFNKGTFN